MHTFWKFLRLVWIACCLKAAGQNTPESKPILEINPNHELIKKLEKVDENQLFSDYASVIFDQAILAEGGQLDDPIGYVNKVNKFIAK